MPDNTLNIRVQADIDKRIKKELGDITVESKKLDLSFKQGKVGADQVAKGIQQLETRLKSLNATEAQTIGVQSRLWHVQNRAALGFKSMAGELRSTNTAAINLGRVFQDMPYGIIGVANNINPLVESMQRLRQEAKETGMGMKQVFSTFMRTGGLTLGFSLFTAALVGMPMLLRLIGDSAEDLAPKMQEAFGTVLSDVGISDLRTVLAGAKVKKEEVGEALDKLITKKSRAARKDATEAFTPSDQDRLDLLKREKLLYEELIKKAQDLIDKQEMLNRAREAGIAAGLRDLGTYAGPPPEPTIIPEGGVTAEERRVSGGVTPRGLSFVYGGGQPPSTGFNYRSGSQVVKGSIGAIESIQKDARGLQSDLLPIWSGIGSSISTFVGGAFRSVFGEANSLAGNLFASILSGLISFGISAGLGAIFAPAVGGGAVGGAFLTGGGASPGVIARIPTRGGRGAVDVEGAMTRALAKGFRLEGTDIVYAYSRAGRMLKERQLGFAGGIPT